MAELEWKRIERGKFGAEQIDSTTGIKTNWEKRVATGSSSRVDTFPDGHLTRMIFTDSMFGVTYGIYSGRRPDIHAKLDHEGTIHNKFEIGINTYPEPDAYLDLDVNYDPDGQLASFDVNLSTQKKASTDVVNMDMDEKMDYFEARPPDVNMKELIDIYRQVGPRVFYSEANDTDIDILKATASLVSEHSMENSGLAPEELKTVLEISGNHLRGFLDVFFDREIANEESKEIVESMTPQVAQLAVERAAGVPKRSAIYVLAMKDAIDWALIWYFQNIKNADSTTTTFSVTDDQSKYKVRVWNSGDDSLSEGEVETGETYGYGEDRITILSSDEERVGIKISNILPSIATRYVDFPRYVNINEYRRIVATDENKGWEEAFKLFEINYRREELAS